MYSEESNIVFYSAGDDESMKLEHRRTYHTSVSTLNIIEKTSTVLGLEALKSTKMAEDICESCINGKSSQVPHPRSDKKLKDIIELLHTDLQAQLVQRV